MMSTGSVDIPYNQNLNTGKNSGNVTLICSIVVTVLCLCIFKLYAINRNSFKGAQ